MIRVIRKFSHVFGVGATAGLFAGFAVGLLILFHGGKMDPRLVSALCPTAFSTMGLDNDHSMFGWTEGLLIILVGSIGWHALLFGLGEALFNKARRSWL